MTLNQARTLKPGDKVRIIKEGWENGTITIVLEPTMLQERVVFDGAYEWFVRTDLGGWYPKSIERVA